MNIQLNRQNHRVPNESVYTIFLTLILALGIIWLIYSSVPYSHYSLYLVEPKK